MASLENVQGLVNSQDVNLGNVSTSNDLLSAGAEEIARGRRAGFSDEETLGVLSRRRRHQHPLRTDARQAAEAQQRYSTITAADGTSMPGELEAAVRSLRNSEVQITQDGGERDQSAIDAYYGRDENSFTRWNKDRGDVEDVYIPDGYRTPDDLRDEAVMRSWGIRQVKTGQEEVLDRRGRVVTNQDGEVIMRNTYDFENVNETTAGQGWAGGGGRAAAGAIERMDGKVTGSQFSDAELAERLYRMYGDNIPAPVAARLRENLRRTTDPQHAKSVEGFFGRRSVQRSNRNFSPAAKAISDARAAREAQMSISSGQAGVDAIEYLPGSLTKTYVDPEGGITIGTNTGAEPDSIFAARPQAVIRSQEAVEIARSLGDDVSAYVDLGTGEGVQGITPSRLQTNMPNTSQQVNAPVTTAASWVASNLKEGSTGDVLADTNISQTTADFSRRVEAAAPGYRSRPVRTVEDFSDQIGRVIAARQAAGKNFYEPAFDVTGKPILTRSGRQKQTKVAEPGIPDVLRLLRMTSGEQGQLANALYTSQTSTTGARPVASFSPGVQVNTGSMFGERLDLGVAPRDSQRAAFARANDEFAQRPQIGAIRERDEFGGVVREEPPLTRAVMKGRSPDEAVATYRAQRAKNNQPVDEEYAEKIRRENASLRADQAALEEDQAVRRIIAQSGTGPVSPQLADDDQFFADTAVKRAASERKAEGRERLELIKLIEKGAAHSSGHAEQYGDRILPAAEKGRKLDVPAYDDPRLVKATEEEGNPRSWSVQDDKVVRGPQVNTTPGRSVNIEGIRGGADGQGAPATAPGISERKVTPASNDQMYDVITRFKARYKGPSGPARPPLADPFGAASGIAPELAARSPLVGANAVTPPSGEPEPISTDAAVKFASERRKMEQNSTRRQSVMDRLSTRNVRIGGGAAVGAGLLAALGISNSRNPEEQYR